MRTIIAVLCLLVSTAGLKAQSFDQLNQDFNPRIHSAADKKYIQTALAFFGTYEALIDGQWGRGSQSALEKALELPSGASVTNRDVAKVVERFHREYGSEAWDFYNDETTGLSFLKPSDGFLRRTDSGGYRTWAHTTRPLEFLVVRADPTNTTKWHKALLDRRGFESDPYVVRNNTRWITSVNQSNGNATYARSELIKGQWSTLIISTKNGKVDNAFKAIAGSIRAGRSDPLVLDSFNGLGNFLALNRQLNGQSSNVNPQNQTQTGIETLLQGSSKAVPAGAGFVVNRNGVVLTSLTNVASCSKVLVAGQPAEVVAQNDLFDLAALATGLKPGDGGWARFSTRPIKPNSSFALAGYKPREFWSDMMIDRGRIGENIGDGLAMEQSGSLPLGFSGGPVLNREGGVVAIIVVEAAPNARKGNVSIKAMHGEIAKLFLAQSDIAYSFMSAKTKIPEQNFEAAVDRFTMPVECVPN